MLQLRIPLLQQTVQDYYEQTKNNWGKTLYQEKQVTMIHSRFTIAPNIMYGNHMCSSGKAKSIKKVGEKNLQKPITQTKSF